MEIFELIFSFIAGGACGYFIPKIITIIKTDAATFKNTVDNDITIVKNDIENVKKDVGL